MSLIHTVAPGILAADTITKLPPDAAGQVVVSGSHGGRYPGYLAAKAGPGSRMPVRAGSC